MCEKESVKKKKNNQQSNSTLFLQILIATNLESKFVIK